MSRPSTRASSKVEVMQIDPVNDDEFTSSYGDDPDDMPQGSSDDDYDSDDSSDGNEAESSGCLPLKLSRDDDNSGSESEFSDHDSSESVDAYVRRWNRGSRSTSTLGEWSRIYKTMQRWSAISLLVLPNL